MATWIQPTTAPKQPDAASEDQDVDRDEPRVERGWMETLHPAEETWVAPERDSIATTSLAIAVVVGFLLLMLVLFPLLLLSSPAL